MPFFCAVHVENQDTLVNIRIRSEVERCRDNQHQTKQDAGLSLFQ